MTTTTRIEGRSFTVETPETPRFESVMSVYGEVVLHGVRGAEYHSERWHTTDNNVVRFWKYSARSKTALPSLAFEGYFVIGGEEGVRPATYKEAKAAVAAFYAKRN